MKNLIILFLASISCLALAEEKESINSVLSQAYSGKAFARGKIAFKNTESKEHLNLYYDGTYKQVSIDDGYYTIEVHNPNKLNLLLVNPENLSISTDEKEKNKVMGLVATASEFKLFSLEKDDIELEGKQYSEWNVTEKELEKNLDGTYKIPANTLIVPLYNKEINLCLDKVQWKRDYNSIELPTITVQGKKEAVETTVRKACWLHMKIGQLHSEQKGKKHKRDNKEITFL